MSNRVHRKKASTGTFIEGLIHRNSRESRREDGVLPEARELGEGKRQLKRIRPD